MIYFQFFLTLKCLERLVLYELRKVLDRFEDPLQFAYRSKWSVDDEIFER